MRILLRFAIGFSAAAAMVLLGLPLRPACGIAAAAAILAAVFLWRRDGLGPIALGITLGLLWTSGYCALLCAPADKLTGQTMEITAVATDYSTPTTYGVKVPARLTAGEQTISGQLWLYTDHALNPGDRISVTARLEAPEGEWRAWDLSEGIRLLAYGQGDPEIMPAPHVPLRALPRAAAHALENSLRHTMPEDTLGYGLALTTGNRSRLTNLEQENLRRSGLYHMMALSGLHLSVLVGTLSLLIKKKRRRALLGIPLCVLFALVTGCPPSIVRAAVMQSLLLLAPALRRETDSPTSLAAAGLLLLLQNPWNLLSVSTQLSFASMAGIQLLGPGLHVFLGEKLPKGRRLLRLLATNLASSLSATAMSVPVLMFYFGSVSLVGPVSNLLALWAVPWCFGGSLLSAMLGLPVPILGSALGKLASIPIRYVQLVAGTMARIPFASLDCGNLYGLGWIILAYGLLLLMLREPRGRRRPIVPLCCGALGLMVCLFLSMLGAAPFAITALDVGQGQSILLTGGGQTVVIDCGGSAGEAVGDQIADRLQAAGETRVDLLILTHYDRDHVSGLQELLARMPVTEMLLPDLEDENRRWIAQAAGEHGTHINYVNQLVRVTAAETNLTLYPPASAGLENVGLCVLSDSGRTRLLVTGDLDELWERVLLAEWNLPDVDILVAGHHGSGTSTSQALLDQTKPELVLISVGKNSYGHPAEEMLRRAEAAGAEIRRTDLCGTIVIKGA